MNSGNVFNNSNNEIVCCLLHLYSFEILISDVSSDTASYYQRLFHGCLIRLRWIIYGIVVEMRKNLKSGMDSFEWAEINEINEINGINGMKFAWTALKCMFNEMQPDRHRFTARCQRIVSRCDQQKTDALTENTSKHRKPAFETKSFFLLFLYLFSFLLSGNTKS